MGQYYRCGAFQILEPELAAPIQGRQSDGAFDQQHVRALAIYAQVERELSRREAEIAIHRDAGEQRASFGYPSRDGVLLVPPLGLEGVGISVQLEPTYDDLRALFGIDQRGDLDA